MSRRLDGREILVRLAYPLPLDIVPELIAAVGRAAEKAGYTDVALDLEDQGAITAVRPGQASTVNSPNSSEVQP